MLSVCLELVKIGTLYLVLRLLVAVDGELPQKKAWSLSCDPLSVLGVGTMYISVMDKVRHIKQYTD